MVIIWGTRYYFAHNTRRFAGICSHCGAETTLKSFTAWQFGHLYFIPLIPGGKHRVLAQCPKCNWVEYIPYKKWERARRQDFDELEKRLAKNPEDPEAIAGGLALCTQYLEPEMYSGLEKLDR